jgi:hypothetical protein
VWLLASLSAFLCEGGRIKDETRHALPAVHLVRYQRSGKDAELFLYIL